MPARLLDILPFHVYKALPLAPSNNFAHCNPMLGQSLSQLKTLEALTSGPRQTVGAEVEGVILLTWCRASTVDMSCGERERLRTEKVRSLVHKSFAMAPKRTQYPS